MAGEMPESERRRFNADDCRVYRLDRERWAPVPESPPGRKSMRKIAAVSLAVSFVAINKTIPPELAQQMDAAAAKADAED